MNSIWALAQKDVRLLLRDKAGFFFTFFFPLIIAIFFGVIFSGGGDGSSAISVLVVDQDQTAGSRQFIALLDSADEINVIPSTRENALNRVRQGKNVAFVVLKPGFGAARERVFWGGAPQIELGVDPSRKAEAGMLKGILTKYAAQRLQTLFSDPGAMKKNVDLTLRALDTTRALPSRQKQSLATFLGDLKQFMNEEESFQQAEPTEDSPTGGGFQMLDIQQVDVVRRRSGPTNAFAISFPQGILWGILGTVAAFGISLVVERSRGTLIRLQSAPLSRFHILAGKALACFITAIGLSTMLIIIGMAVFHLRSSSPPLLIAAILSIAFGFVGIMMFLAVLGKTEQSAGGIGWAILLIMSMLGGGMIPLFIMPKWMQTFSNISPVKWAILALEGATWRNFSAQEMLLPIVILLSVGVVFFTIGVKSFKWSTR